MLRKDPHMYVLKDSGRGGLLGAQSCENGQHSAVIAFRTKATATRMLHRLPKDHDPRVQVVSQKMCTMILKSKPRDIKPSQIIAVPEHTDTLIYMLNMAGCDLFIAHHMKDSTNRLVTHVVGELIDVSNVSNDEMLRRNLDCLYTHDVGLISLIRKKLDP